MLRGQGPGLTRGKTPSDLRRQTGSLFHVSGVKRVHITQSMRALFPVDVNPQR